MAAISTNVLKFAKHKYLGLQVSLRMKRNQLGSQVVLKLHRLEVFELSSF